MSRLDSINQMPFGKNARITFEHGGENLANENYRTVTYWYGHPGATLVLTDTLKVGDAVSERAHGYVSPDASAPYTLKSRYEWGPDVMRGFSRPAAQPADYAEFEFEAEAGVIYGIFVRGRPLRLARDTDELWFQFDDEIGTTISSSARSSEFAELRARL